MSLLWTGDGKSRGLPRQTRTVLVLLLAALPVYVLALGANSIWDANEAFYVETPRHMVETGNYLTPYFNGLERLNKPVLSYWIVAGLYHLAGVSVTVERVGIAIGALGIIGATFAIGMALRSPLTGLLAALFVATSPRMVMFSRRIFIDIWVTCFMAITLACLVLAERYPRHRRSCLLAMYVAMGLGVLTKGPIAIVFPALTVAVWMTVERRWGDVRRLMLVPGALIVAAIVVPWYAALYQVHGWGPIAQFFIGENVGRYTGEMSSEGRGVFFYLPVLFGDLFPWAPLLCVPILHAWRPAAAGEPVATASIRRMLWIWIVGMTATFSLSQSKQDLYIFPVVPAVAALVAHLLVAHFAAPDRWVSRLLGAVAALTVASGIAVWWLFQSGYYALDGVGWLALTCVTGGVATWLLVMLGRRRQAVYTLALAFVVFNYLFVLRVLPDVERLKPSVPLAAEIRARAGDEDRVGAYHMMFPSLVHYVGRPIEEIGSEAHARSFFAPERAAWAIMSDSRYAELALVLPAICVADRRPLFEAKLSDLISRQPSADVLLVTNRCQTAPAAPSDTTAPTAPILSGASTP